MLFNSKIEPRCAYCARGTPLEGSLVLCIKHGILASDQSCSKFRYDPLKRVPPRPNAPDFSRLKEEDFKL